MIEGGKARRVLVVVFAAMVLTLAAASAANSAPVVASPYVGAWHANFGGDALDVHPGSSGSTPSRTTVRSGSTAMGSSMPSRSRWPARTGPTLAGRDKRVVTDLPWTGRAPVHKALRLLQSAKRDPGRARLLPRPLSGRGAATHLPRLPATSASSTVSGLGFLGARPVRRRPPGCDGCADAVAPRQRLTV